MFLKILLKLLQENPSIKKQFEEKLNTDESFAKNPQMQLYWIYTKTPHYEKAHKKLPIFKLY